MGGLSMLSICLFLLVASISHAVRAYKPAILPACFTSLVQLTAVRIRLKLHSISRPEASQAYKNQQMAFSRPTSARPNKNINMSTPRKLPAMSPPPHPQHKRTDSVTGIILQSLKTCTSCAGKDSQGYDIRV